MSKERRNSLIAFVMTTLAYVPAMLIWNIWGNALIERIEDDKTCTFEGVA